MDYQFRPLSKSVMSREFFVSILVLMDYQFRPFVDYTKVTTGNSFHPCFNGLSI